MRSTKLDNEILDATKNSTHEECVQSLGVQFKNISAWRREHSLEYDRFYWTFWWYRRVTIKIS